ncbi:MAG: methyltransferase domain-containing protein [Alphaproteobacteria bacterium]|nr:MAG: methyltransferase domain-containing protein [Alphaproteobacteria bacterium]
MRGDRVNADASVFFALWLQKPLRIAAANPSGARLADAVGRCIDLNRPGPILELGAGTGSLTQGLVRAGCPPERIIALESEPALVAVLRREFPAITVIEGDATQIGGYLAGKVERLASVVSSLPIKWFSVEAQHAVIRPCLDLLGPGGRFLQLTNAFTSPVLLERLGIAGREVGRVWLNLLPAQIWAYSIHPDWLGGGGAR